VATNLLQNLYHEDRPWGSFDRLTADEVSTVKILRVDAGKRFSLQKHAHRSEFWRCIQGDGFVTVGEMTKPITVGDEVLIPAGTLHRLAGGAHGIEILEIWPGGGAGR
jgi:mannose-6-phosphate isomerase-like protein (cupin superfamily)